MSKKPLKGVLASCTPREEVLKGELDDAIFAADFGQLIEGNAPDVYGNPASFFRNTEPTPDLKAVCTTVLYSCIQNFRHGKGCSQTFIPCISLKCP